MKSMQGRTFDWKGRHDPQSRGYPARPLLPAQLPVARFWAPPKYVLDQGAEGACVGFAWAAEAGSSPVRIPNVNNDFARGLYNWARRNDEWEGEDYEGTSVLAGAKALHHLGLIGEYRWAFGPDDMRDSVLGLGPAVIGVPYFRSMFYPRPSGLVEVVSDGFGGGHAMCVLGFHSKMRIPGESWLKRFAVYKLRQSWGPDFGRKGDIYIREEDMAGLIDKSNYGEVCIPLTRMEGAR